MALTKVHPSMLLGGSFGNVYDSGQQTITAGGTLALSHGLAVQPKIIQIWLHCTSADAGYSTGDEVLIAAGAIESASGTGIAVVANTSLVTVRFGSAASTFVVTNNVDGTAAAITNSKWKLVVRAAG